MKRRNLKNMNKSNLLFHIFNFVFWVAMLFIVIYPLYLICIASISDADAVTRGDVTWRPVNISMIGYEAVLKNTKIWVSYANSFLYVIGGLIVAITMTMLAAYAMSRRTFPGKKAFTWYILVTMFFGGGLIPTFLVIKDIGLYNTRTLMIILGCFSTWNLMVARVYIQSTLPEELYEAAVLDGASHFQYFFKVVLPLSKTIIAVLTVYYGIGKWNDYFTGLVYLRDEALYPLQTVLRGILASLNPTMADDVVQVMDNLESLVQARKIANVAKYCVIVISTGPAVVLYMTMQKYFEKGVMIGSLKG